MSFSSRRVVFSLALAFLAAPFGCGSTAPAPALPVAAPSASAMASAAPPVTAAPVDEPVPQLRTGELARIEHAEVIEGSVAASHVDAAYETLAVTLKMPVDLDVRSDAWEVVALDGATAGPHAFASVGRSARAGRARR